MEDFGDFSDLIETSYRDRIVADPNILVGKPTVKGTRISVELVLDFLSTEFDFDALLAAYPRLTKEDVKAVLAYARAVVIGVDSAPRPLIGAGLTRRQ